MNGIEDSEMPNCSIKVKTKLITSLEGPNFFLFIHPPQYKLSSFGNGL